MISIKKFVKYLGNVIAILSIIFVIWAVIKLDIDLTQIKSMPVFISIGISGAVLVGITVYGMAFAWKLILQYLSGKKVDYLDAAKIYAKANIGKYMPGNVMHYVERNLFASQIGLGQLEVAVSSGIEIAGVILSAVLLSVILAYQEFIATIQSMISIKIIFLVLVLFLLLCIAGILFYKRSLKLQKMLERIWNIKFMWLACKVMLVYSLVLMSQGLLLMLICRYVLQCELTNQQALLIIAYYILAWVVGFVVPGAPGGIGVREMIIVMLMNGVVGEEIIIVAALIHRMISILGDGIAYVSSLLIKKRT